ncbi:DNA methyltransferase [Vibrio phage CP-T1]|uniref:DNA methyltransferase n=1 Tax=Vibrio phage CP-T1 TaxID=10689 RepID=UPI0002536C9C|nr:DNA methyltransferase [Vibrio phage CP-T1]AFC22394.1 putative methylase [Vibrio phage CP-T1]AIA08753.1 DNA-cytosine methyltransferase [Vibrio phage 24]
MITYGSVCSGIESATVAWEPLGFEPKWFSQFDPEHNYNQGLDFPSTVLAHHYPHVMNIGDLSNLPELMRYGALSAPDLIVGGTPCQAFSVAGKRGSLADARGGLSLIYGDLLNAIDEQRGTGNEAVCLWENVPGVLNTADNAFGWLLGLLAGEYVLADCVSGTAQPLEAQPGASRQKWPKSGCVIGPIRTVAWRILDAQYFGLAQRRKRVFVVASARKGFDPAEVLFEREGVRRDSAPSREALQEAAGIIRDGSHWDDPRNAHPTLNQSFNTGGIGASNQEIFSQRGAGVVGHRQVAFGEYACDETASTMKARDYKDATDLVVHTIHDKATRYQGGGDTRNGDGSGNGLGVSKPHDPMYTLTTADRHAVSTPAVRRLTPVECERLQGFPDNYTNVPYRGKPAPDGQRYKAIGNSKAVPVVRWLGLRIAMELLK